MIINIVHKEENTLLKNLQFLHSTNNLARELGITVCKLQEGFKEILGDTVYEYTKKLRIEKSKILLEKIGMLIIPIANELRYENPSEFSSVFKSYMNMTPSEYRQRKI